MKLDSELAATITSVLPMRMPPSSRSVRLSSSATRTAERWPCVTRCFSRYRLIAIIAVSAIEKKDDSSSSATSAATCQLSGHCSCISAPMQNHFEDEAAAWIGEHEHDETGERPAQSGAPTPAVKPAPREQQGENQPRQDHKQRLVVEAHGAAEKGLRIGNADNQGDCQHGKRRADQTKHEAFQGEQWRHVAQRPLEPCAALGRSVRGVQAPLDRRNEQRMERRDHEKAVGKHAKEKMQSELERDGVRARSTREECGQRRTKRSGGERHRIHELYSKEEALEPADQDGQPHHHRERLREAETQFGGVENLRVKQGTVNAEGDQDDAALPRSQSCCRRTTSPARVPEMPRQPQIHGRGKDGNYNVRHLFSLSPMLDNLTARLAKIVKHI